ncbi:MAG: MarR family winged helix-turn-helix transcriptional regulator [Nitrospinota bacterium]
MAIEINNLTDNQDHESSTTQGDLLQLRVWLRLLTCTTMIGRQIRGRLRQGFATTLSRYDALAQLERAPDGLTMGQLSRRMMVSNGNVTGVVDCLVEEGFAERVAVPGDRRASFVRMTQRGREEFNKITPVHHSWIREMFHDMDRGDLDRLLNILGDLKSSILNSLEKQSKTAIRRQSR